MVGYEQLRKREFLMVKGEIAPLDSHVMVAAVCVGGRGGPGRWLRATADSAVQGLLVARVF